MAYAFIHGEVKGSGASVEFKGNGLDLLDLTIQIVGSVVADVLRRGFFQGNTKTHTT